MAQPNKVPKGPNTEELHLVRRWYKSYTKDPPAQRPSRRICTARPTFLSLFHGNKGESSLCPLYEYSLHYGVNVECPVGSLRRRRNSVGHRGLSG